MGEEKSRPPTATEDQAGLLQSLLNAISDASKQVPEVARKTVELVDHNSVHCVLSGNVDIFLAQGREDSSQGRRLHVARIPEGNIILGIAENESSSDTVFIAVPAPDTELVQVEWGSLRDRAQAVGRADFLCMLIDIWIENLSSSWSSWQPSPGSFEDLASGELPTIRKNTFLGVSSGVTWVRHLHGSSQIMGKEGLSETDQRRSMPICNATWLIAGEDVTLKCLSTKDLLEDGTLTESLVGFHSVASRIIIMKFKEEQASKALEMERQEEKESRLISSALEKLSSVVTLGKPELKEITGDPLVDAFRMVAARIGAPVRPKRKASGEFIEAFREMCRETRIRYREVLLSGKWWREDHGSILGFLAKDGQPVAILQDKPGQYKLWNPVTNAHNPLNGAMALEINPVAYSLHAPFPNARLKWRDLVMFALSGTGSDLRRIFASAVLAGLLALVPPIAVGILFDDIIPDEDRHQLLGLCAALLAACVCGGLFQFVQSVAQLRLEGKTSWRLQTAMWDRLLSLPVDFFRKYASGDLANRSFGIDQMRRLISGTAIPIVISSFLSMFQVGLLFYYSMELAIVALLMVAISLVIPCVSLLFQLRYQRPLYDVIGKIQAFNLQVINGISKLRVSGAENKAFHIWADSFSKQKTLSYKSGVVGNVLSVTAQSLSLTGTLGLFVWVFLSNDRALHAMSTGHFLAFLSSFTTVLMSTHCSLNALFPLVALGPLYTRARPIVETLPEVPAHAADPERLSGHIELSGVSFRYNPEGPLTIANISLEIKPREFVAFVGPSGSGKSTILRLLLGFEQPEAGAIFYDRQDLRQLNVLAVRRQIGVVLQTSVLFSGSIFENVIGAANLTLDQAWEAIRLADLEEEIKSMPMGMNTVIGEGGEGLSGGQRQRLLIARAIVKKPRLLYFDEATSALDNQSQTWVTKSLEQLKGTRIVIAHRLSTIMHADRIVVVVNGEIMEEGAYDDLMAKGKVFYKLARRQLA